MPGSDPIYLDHNATTPLLPEVVDAMLPYLREHFGNPSSGHIYGTRARDAVARARAQVAALLECDDDEVLFTSGGTEANNLAIRGATEARPERPHVLTTVIEHPATARPCDWLARHGTRVSRIAVDAHGVAGHGRELGDGLEHAGLVVRVHHAHERTLAVQRGAREGEVRDAGAWTHTDAAQSVGKVPVRVRSLGVDLLSIAGHKLYAPKGVGALYVRRGIAIAPFALGAGHERGLRPGTENVASIVGLGAACELARRDLDKVTTTVCALRDQLHTTLAAEIPGLALNGHRDLRLPNTLNVRFPGATGGAVLEGAPEIAASTGSACHEGHERAS